MTQLQQVLLQLETPYYGHPYFITGHALYSAIARRVSPAVKQALQVSTGVFVPGEYGVRPEACSDPGYAGKLGTALPAVETYSDLFLLRDPAHRWLLDSRPRDAHNVQAVQDHGGRQVVAPECWFGKPAHHRNARRSVQWYVHAYFHAGDEDGILPIAETVLNSLQLGGGRNYGFGAVSLADTNLVELDDLSYDRLQDADDVVLELCSPYVLSSECPDADDQDVPWWWDVPEQGLRRRRTRLVRGDEEYDLQVVDHGQVLGYAGNAPVVTAVNGVLGVGTHAKFGFGEFRLRPTEGDRVAERVAAEGES